MTVTEYFGWPLPDEGSSTEIWKHFEALGKAVDTTVRMRTGGPWATYAPTWESAGSPAVNDGELLGWWRNIGFQVEWEIWFLRGQNTNIGNAFHVFGLPPAAPGPIGYRMVTGSGVLSRGPIPLSVIGVGNRQIGAVGPGGRFSSAYPGGLAAGDFMLLQGQYRTNVYGMWP